MATPVKNKLLIGIRAVWWIFKVKCESTHYLFFLTEAAAVSQATAEIASVFIHGAEPRHKASWLFAEPGLSSNEPLKNH